MYEIVLQIFLLFAYIGVGFIANKVKLLDQTSDRYFSNLLLKITLPAAIIASSIGQKSENRGQAFYVLALGIGIFIALPLMANIYQKVTKTSNTYKLMLTYPNLGFMGLPILGVLYGQIGMFYSALFMIVFNLSVFSYGVSVIQNHSKFDIKKLLNPGIVAAVIAILIFSFEINVPAPITQFLSGIGSITSPLAMVTLGSTIGSVDLASVFKDKKLYVFSFSKLILWPAIIWFVLQFFVESPMVLGVCTILMSLPVAGNVTMLSITYGGDVDVAVKGTCLSTLLSLFTIPVYMILFMP